MDAQVSSQDVARDVAGVEWKSRLKDWAIRIAIILGAALWLALMGTSWVEGSAEAAEKEPPSEYSFRWLDPDKKIYVLQNRKYLKAEHLMLSLLGGPAFSNSYRNVMSVDGRFSYYFSEAFGLEFFYRKSMNSENNTFKALVNTNTPVYPVVREINAEYGGTLHWVPWYAKINVFNNILYFDWYFSGGAGTIDSSAITRDKNGSQSSTSQQMFALFFGTGHQYHLSQSFTVRLDLTGTYYRAPVFGTSGEQVWFSNYNLGIGFGLRI